MPRPVQVIVVEGRLEVPTSKKILAALNHPPEIPEPIDKAGRTNFWPDIGKYNQAAQWGPCSPWRILNARRAPVG
jgi:hypothetical protein